MAPNLRKIIEKIDEHNQYQSEIEQRLDLLQTENIKLRILINEQKEIIEKQKQVEQKDIPEEIQILKDMILALREKVEERERDVQKLRNDNLSLQEKLREFDSNTLVEDNKEVLRKVQDLTELNNQLNAINDENLKEIDTLNKELNSIRREHKRELPTEIMRLRIESLRQEKEYLKYIYHQNERINGLNEYVENLKMQIRDLHVKESTTSTKKEQYPKKLSIKPYSGEYQSFYYQLDLILNLITLLQERDKKTIMLRLFRDLKTKDFDVRRFIIKILSKIKTPEVYKELVDNLKDPNWLIRLSILHAIKNFDNKEIKSVLESLLNDSDVDVRETASQLLEKY